MFENLVNKSMELKSLNPLRTRPLRSRRRMVVDQAEGTIIGWLRGDPFIPLGVYCCESPLECTRCFLPVE